MTGAGVVAEAWGVEKGPDATGAGGARKSEVAALTLERAVDRLLSLQHADGWWKGELKTNVAIEAEDLLLRKFLGILSPEVLEPTARWIRSRQPEDAAWGTFYGGPGDVSTTIEAYAVLRLAGDPAGASHMRRAREFILKAGGIEASRVFTRLWLALRRVRGPGETPDRLSIERGVEWVLGMQSRDGGWAAFDADNTRDLVNELPFCDFGAVIDPPSADVTGHVVEMLAGEGAAGSLPARRVLRGLEAAQEADGSWSGRWGANHVYGIGAVVPAAVAAGVSPDDARIRRALDWLARHQNEDGDWGEDMRSQSRPDVWSGRGRKTASPTAWALLALLAAGREGAPETSRGVAFLAAAQTGDGGWDEPEYTGTGFPGDFFINYHLYRLVFPVQALGRYVHGHHPSWGAGGARARRRPGGEEAA